MNIRYKESFLDHNSRYVNRNTATRNIFEIYIHKQYTINKEFLLVHSITRNSQKTTQSQSFNTTGRSQRKRKRNMVKNGDNKKIMSQVQLQVHKLLSFQMLTRTWYYRTMLH